MIHSLIIHDPCSAPAQFITEDKQHTIPLLFQDVSTQPGSNLVLKLRGITERLVRAAEGPVTEINWVPEKNSSRWAILVYCGSSLKSFSP